MLHNVSGGSFGNINDIKVITKELDDINVSMVDLLSKHSEMSVDFINDMIRRDKYLTPMECLEYGLCDSVLDFEFKNNDEE